MGTLRKTVKHEVAGMRQVTEDEWSDFLLEVTSTDRIHGTEKNRNTLDHVREPDGFHIATVVYHDWPTGKIVSHHVTTAEIPKLTDEQRRTNR